MRLLPLLFSLYFACLSCLPCTDGAVACVEPAGRPTVTATHSDLAGASRADWCSPLCQCHCCAGVVAPAPRPRCWRRPGAGLAAGPTPGPAGRTSTDPDAGRRVAAALGLTPSFSC
ncbi:DUF6660 family protein [Hymenobacter amundsenii]|uniref:DUF6660 family protein n=1 Tax=Hymenobacter amundsenii TaxID=2006685 RepID=UPI0037446C6F